MSKMDTEKFLVIYCYYEIRNYQKNQTNLSFFINHGLNKKNWRKLDVDYLFIINGFQCEVLIPEEDNIKILKRENSMDFEGWNEGMNYLENLYECDIYDKYTHIFFINCSVLGPLADPNLNFHWLEPYYNKLIKENSYICSNIITNLPSSDLGGPGFRCSSYCFLLKIDKKILNILRKKKIVNVNETSLNKSVELDYNTIFGKKRNRLDAVLTGEYGLSRMLLKEGYKLSCLLYDEIDYKLNPTLDGNIHQDRFGTFKGNNLPISKIIFYKNIWRVENHRDSLPIEYVKCKEFIDKYSNFKYDTYNINYDSLKVNETGITLKDQKYSWKSKKEFYNYHGYSEEVISFPNILENNKSLAIYHHFDSDNIIKDYVISSLKSLMVCGYDIYFATSCSSIENVDLPFEIHYYENYGVGTDLITYYNILKENIDKFEKKYEWVFITNDSVIFPINGNEHFKSIINEQRKDVDFWGHWSSNENEKHLIGTLLEFNNKSLRLFLKLLSVKLAVEKKEELYYVFNIETKILSSLVDNGMKYSIVIDCDDFNYEKHISPFSPHNFYKWIKYDKTFAIKWKYMANYIDIEYVNKEYLNYLMRFLHFGPNGPKGQYQKRTCINPKLILIDMIHKKRIEKEVPYNFIPSIYKKIHEDLVIFSTDEQLTNHYVSCGKKEGRIYREIPKDFNSYIYKELNPDLKNLSEKNLKIHYLTVGMKECRSYRVIPNDFIPSVYKKINKDLHNFNEKELTNHYINYGRKENRTYKEIPKDFDYEKYRNENKDLYFLSCEELKYFYINYEGLYIK
jgi:hypothetical protein